MGGLAFFLVSASVGVAAWRVAKGWNDARHQRFPTLPPEFSRPMDDEPHTLALLEPNGQPKLKEAEHFGDYKSALTRQRLLTKDGKHSMVYHTKSGEVRIDLVAMVAPWHRMHY